MEGQAKREKQNTLEELLLRKIGSVRYPMQELDLNYPSTKGKIYSAKEEDRYLLVRQAYYGLGADDVFERIKKDITEFPVFRFDWFFKSRTPQELSRRAKHVVGDDCQRRGRTGFTAATAKEWKEQGGETDLFSSAGSHSN